MDRREAAGLRQDLQDLPDVAEFDHAALVQGADVGREDLDRRMPRLHRLGQRAEQIGGLRAAQHQMKAVIAMAVAGEFALALLDRALQRNLGQAEREIQ